MAFAILQEEANFTRLSKLLVDKGTEALRNTLDAIHPPANLAAALNTNKATLLRLKPRVINVPQWDLLFPPSGNPPDSKTFDVTLLTVLLRNICGFIAPARGWNTMPPGADRSPQANFTRIRLYRNELYAHVNSTQVDGATFESLWQKISQALVDLKIPRKEIDDLKFSPLGPEEELYLQTLKEWCRKEEDLNAKVELVHQQQRDDSEAIQHLTKITEENRQGIRQLCDSSSNQIDSKEVLDDLKIEVKLMHQQQRENSEASKTSVQHLTQIAEESRQGIQQLCHLNSKEIVSERKEVLDALTTEVKLMHQQQRDDSEALKTSVQQIAKMQIESERLQQANREDDPSQKLAKHNFTSKIRHKVKSFHPGTRGWLLKKLEQWFTTDDESRALLLTAGPGFGKSVFAAKVCELFKEKGKFAACHFCDFSNSNLNDPMLMLESLASQMCENVPGFKEKLLNQLRRSHKIQNLKDAFQIYLQNPLDELEVVELRLIVIDGLDESATNGKSDLVKLIADYFPSLPECVKVLVTSRPELSLKMLSHIATTTIDAVGNNVDLEKYLKDCIPSIADRRMLDDDQPEDWYYDTVLAAVVNKCQGSFLYAFHIQQELGQHENLDTMTFQEIMSVLPQGIGSVYQDYFRRLESELEAVGKSSTDLFKLLELFAAAKDFLPLSFLARALDLAADCRETKRIINKVNEAVSCLLYVSDDLVTVFHKSVYDWLLADGYEDHEYTVKTRDSNKRLWLICERVFEEIKRTVSLGDNVKLTNEVEHALKHGHEYLVSCSMVDSFSWLVDMVIVHLILTLHPKRLHFLHLIENVLLSDVSLGRPLRQRFSWHYTELSYINSKDLLACISSRICLPLSNSYLEAVLDYAPKGCFTDSEKQIAEAILAKNQRHIKRDTVGVKARNLLTATCKPFSTLVAAVGVSLNKMVAAVALMEGTILILSLPELVILWEHSTQCESISCCTFTPDDSFVLYGKLETVLSIEGKNEASFFHGKVERFKSCAFSPNGKRLVTNDGSSSAKLWDVVKQCLISVLYAGVPLHHSYFTNTGLFIIGDHKYSKEDSYCVWSAITLQRVDERSLSVRKPRKIGGVIKSGRCNRCVREERKEIIPSGLQVVPVICNDVECIFYLDRHCLRIIDTTHFTTLAVWELFVKSTRVLIAQVTVIADEVFLFVDVEKMVVFSTVHRKGGQGCLPSPTRVLWCSFSPDGTRLASCTSDGFINISNVDMCQVYRRFKSNGGTSSAACWWSDRFLFVFCFIDETPSLSKYPVDVNFEVTTTQGQPVSLYPVMSEFSFFSRILDFSEGYLSFECGETKPVTVLDVNRIGPPESVVLPGVRPMMKIAVSSGACFVLGAGDGFYLWKRNEAQPTRYDVFASYLPPVHANTTLWQCCFGIDLKLAVVSFMRGLEGLEVLEELGGLQEPWKMVSHVIDVETGIYHEFTGGVLPPMVLISLRVVCNRMELILLRENVVVIVDLGTTKRLETSFQRYIPKELMFDSKLSPKGNVLAVPRVTGDMEFIRFNVPEYSPLQSRL